MRKRLLLPATSGCLTLILAAAPSSVGASPWATSARVSQHPHSVQAELVRAVPSEHTMVAWLQAECIGSPEVRQAMRDLPRKPFAEGAAASEMERLFNPTCAVCVSHNPWVQLSRPSTVAHLTDLVIKGLAPERRQEHRLLEVGTGTGYQIALAKLLGFGVARSIEYHREVARKTSARLQSLGLEVEVRSGDGFLGWPDKEGYDRILLSVAGSENDIQPLLRQLRPWGRLIGPIVGANGETQELLSYSRRNDSNTFDISSFGLANFMRCERSIPRYPPR